MTNCPKCQAVRGFFDWFTNGEDKGGHGEDFSLRSWHRQGHPGAKPVTVLEERNP